MKGYKLGLYIGLIGLGCFALVDPALAKKQDKAACQALRSARAHLLRSGIRDDMSNGPEWVIDNLAAEQIERIKLYLTVDAMVTFQCRGGGSAIKRKRSAASRKKVRTRKSAPKKKIIRKKTYRKKKTYLKKKKTSSSVAFDPFSGN